MARFLHPRLRVWIIVVYVLIFEGIFGAVKFYIRYFVSLGDGFDEG